MPLTRPLRAVLPRRPAPTEPQPRETRLTVCGELDFHTVAQLCWRIEAHLSGCSDLVIDLSGATFYDQAAIDALAQVHVRARQAGCRLCFTKAPAALRARMAPALTPA